MMSLWDALRMNMMISYQELVRTFPNYTAMIMRNFNIREATIVTRAGHIRRGTVLMNNALKLYVPWQVNLTSMAWKDSNFATEDDAKKPPKLGSGDYRSTYRDVLRLYRQEYPGFAM